MNLKRQELKRQELKRRELKRQELELQKIERWELEEAASAVIQMLKNIPEFASCKLAVTGGLALWKHIPGGRITEDLDFVISTDMGPKLVKSELRRLHRSRFWMSCDLFYYIASNERLIPVDMIPPIQSLYLPAAAVAINLIPEGFVPYTSAVDLIALKVYSCGLRVEKTDKVKDAMDAEHLLRQETVSRSLILTEEQILYVKAGLPDVLSHAEAGKAWWLEKLGIETR